MSKYLLGINKKQKWYSMDIFSLVPVFEYIKADEQSTSNFCFRWLFFTVWTIDSLEFEIAIVASTHWGIGVIGLLPYFRWCVCIPCPDKLGIWIDRNFSRSRDYD
ncbi:hypothetical protein SAMN05421780_11056 [Flexibacter flexilis DSM 6793]|uniref:Uncharacterized protein n=1 Tax=Flexibacter flexilis DSM 6793 TaxID=927664 RepID=A0A1I1MDF4_9BACT|nr:hypothetical protein [Flexibacter flexilis]SFC81118.1 hypothetical protein SAMN05421780_11056 [Flexibacter flexilis DSM 6793]